MSVKKSNRAFVEISRTKIGLPDLERRLASLEGTQRFMLRVQIDTTEKAQRLRQLSMAVFMSRRTAMTEQLKRRYDWLPDGWIFVNERSLLKLGEFLKELKPFTADLKKLKRASALLLLKSTPPRRPARRAR
jgi:hypothetical protein